MSVNFRVPKTNIEFNPPVYMCKKATKPFTLDGNIDKPFWEDIPFTDYFVDIEGDVRPEPRFKTRAKMTWDNENLYFGAVLEGPEIWATLTERDCVIFQDNDFEIFVDSNSDTHAYFEFEMNALNTVWDLMLTKPYRDGGKPINAFDIQGLQTAVHIDGELNNPKADNKRWMVEVVMPFAVLRQGQDDYNRNPKAGEYYRVNFSRVHWRVDETEAGFTKQINPETGRSYPEDNWVWAPTGLINIHYPELWGFVFFAEGDETYEIPADEYTKWELRRLYYKQHEHYDLHGHFTTDFEALKGDWNFTITPEIEVTKNAFEMRALSTDGKKEITIFSDSRTMIQEVK
ncbi:carbohydrate-binding family 9-like protein [Niameybacter massiliensis]|uniref:Carbohydrate-binding family 9-like protein n=1 Tax=Holtiella tumoricola TaxID=3018743 RepID=A0AA42J294_9FIRM|nr:MULTISPECIES: carbohydrate-binding family 9-like protein [Lachnospirales]MDA3733429.1 carbohydrate-binding family 9-like protein [Holtiella tumoricola]